MTSYDDLTLGDLHGLCEQIRGITGVAGCALGYGHYDALDEPRTVLRVTVSDVQTTAARLESFGLTVVRVEQEHDRDVCICTFDGTVGR